MKFSGLVASLFLFSSTGLAMADTASAQSASGSESGQLLTIERLYASPSLNGPTAKGVKFSPDGQRVTFLKARAEDSARYDLWQFDVATGEQSLLVDSTLLEPEEVELSEAEKALRERKRIAGQKGIVSYDWGTANTILVPIGGDLHLVTLHKAGPEVRQLTKTEAFEYDARVSPLGHFVSFVRDGAVYVINLASKEEVQITPDADPDNGISYGVAEFVAQEEMSRYTGYWWSPDQRYIAYTKVDESTVDVIERFDIAAEKTTVIDQRYPRAGRPNAIVDLFVKDLHTGDTTEVKWRQDEWGPATDQYLARVGFRDSDLFLTAVNRDQNTFHHLIAQLRSLDEHEVHSTGSLNARMFRHERGDTWLNLDNASPAVEFYTSEKDGYRHIYDSRKISNDEPYWSQVTYGSWVVDQIVLTVERKIFFTGYRDTPLERHLYLIDWSDENLSTELPLRNWDSSQSELFKQKPRYPDPIRLTEAGKSWSVTMSPDGKSFVGTSSSPTQPPQTGLYTAEGELIAWIEENRLDENHPYFPYLENHTTPTFGTLTAEDGQTLYYSYQTPPDFDPNKQYPVIVEVYGGPHVQTVDRDWEKLSDVFYTHQGYIVFRLDNRGSWNRGKAFEDVIYRQTGGPEVRDQLKGVEWLKEQSFVDADRIAIQGWSYGGYMTLMTLLQAEPDTFAAAASGAPVTDWSLYDTFYTERYMDTPQDNADGYEKSSVFYHLGKWEGDLPPLLLMHGMADDNVTFDNMTRLMAELQQRGLMFDVMTYPGQRHGIRGEALQIHLMKTRMRFLNQYLKIE